MAVCYRHPSRETGVSCSSCGRPICPDCMTPTSVGMRCPECARERTKVKTVRSGSTAPVVTQALIAINVVVFLGETATGAPLGGVTPAAGTLYENGALFGPYIDQVHHQYWRLVTSGFLHDGLLHIAFNMLFLYFVGPMLEPAIGRLNFAVVYFVSLLAGSFGALLFSPQIPTVGASGAIFGVLGALIVVAHYRGISIWQSGLGITLLINLVFSLSVSGISIGGHLGGLRRRGHLRLADRAAGRAPRSMPSAAIAGCVVVGVVSVDRRDRRGRRHRSGAERHHHLTASYSDCISAEQARRGKAGAHVGRGRRAEPLALGRRRRAARAITLASAAGVAGREQPAGLAVADDLGQPAVRGSRPPRSRRPRPRCAAPGSGSGAVDGTAITSAAP